MKYLIKSLIENYRNKMTAKLALGFIMFLYIPIPLYSQVTVKEFEPKVESLVQKPIPYDSLRNLEYQKNFNDNKQYIGLQLFLPEYVNPIHRNEGIILYSNRLNKLSNIMTKVYKPYCYKPDKEWNTKYLCSDAKETGNKYYTILDVLNKEQFWRIISAMNTSLRHPNNGVKQSSPFQAKDKDPTKKYPGTSESNADYFDDINDGIKYRDDIPDEIFMIKDNLKKDTAYLIYKYFSEFVLVPYFVKIKQLYDGKNLIAQSVNVNNTKFSDISSGKSVIVAPRSKWICEVNLLKQQEGSSESNLSYTLSYILKNDKNETIVLESLEQRDQYLFITEEEFIKREIEAKNQELLKKLKNEELAAKKIQEAQIKSENEKLAKQNRLKMCITLYGQKFGELVAQEKVTIGMTTEMCLDAWGKPFDTNRTITENAVYEHWYYSWHRSLHFESGILKMIED